MSNRVRAAYIVPHRDISHNKPLYQSTFYFENMNQRHPQPAQGRHAPHSAAVL